MNKVELCCPLMDFFAENVVVSTKGEKLVLAVFYSYASLGRLSFAGFNRIMKEFESLLCIRTKCHCMVIQTVADIDFVAMVDV